MKTRKKLFFAAVLALGLWALCGPALADELLVPDDYLTIQAAIDAAVDSDVVIVADGTYTGTGNKNLDFGGRAITVRSENGPEFTTIDCENDGSAFTFHTDEAQDSVVAGFTITRGSSYNGGAISCDNSSPTIKDCIFSANQAEHNGGAMYVVAESSPVIENCTFKENRAGVHGGGACFGSSAALVSGCIFIKNVCYNSSADGGAIFNTGDISPTIVNCLFVGNTAIESGGAIRNYLSSPTIINCTFNGNSTRYGGAICNAPYASPIITNCIFWGNSASLGDEIDNNGDCHPTISYCDIEGGWNGPHVTNRSGSSTIDGGGNIAADPLFIDAVNPDLYARDYHLADESPCIDAGDPCYIAHPHETDIDGDPRILGGCVDIGADEFTPTNKAFAPRPADGAMYVDPNVVLSWSPGIDALSHDVYLGTDPNDVNEATPDSNEYMGNYEDSSYDPCGLDYNTTYCWRIDEVADSNTYKGDVWSFMTRGEPDSCLLGWWTFDEGEGTIAYDSAGTNDGIIHEATWTTGQINSALSFDGVNDYVYVPDDYSLDLGTHDLSFAFWFITNESSDEQMLGKRSTTTGPHNRVADGFGAALHADGTVFVHFRHSASSDSVVDVTSTASYNDGNWHHLAGVYTRSANIELYVDGVPEGTPGDISYAEGADIDLTQPLAIGSRVLYGVSNEFYFNGSIDEVRIYNRALSGEEILEVYRDGWCEEGYPCIKVWPKTLEFAAEQAGPNPAPQTLSVSNFGDGILNYQITEDCSWLEVDPNAGSSAGEPNEATVSVDVSGLTSGLYECDLIVSDPNASNSPQIVHVQLEIILIDCNGNLVPDPVDIAVGTSQDCNGNGIPDECDIAEGRSTDVNDDGIPDECQLDVRVVPIAVLIDPAETSEVRTTLPDSMAGVVRGSTYYIEIWASDIGEINTGLTGVYVDVHFCDQTSASAVEHGEIFVTFPDGTIQPGGVDEFGGAALVLPSPGIEPDWVRVGWIQMSAHVEVEICTISLSPSSTGVAALERGAIPWTFVDLGSVELQITPPARSYDLDGDDFIGLSDLSFFAGSWQQHVPPADEAHDFDCDNKVGVGDLSWFATGWQKNTNDPTILYPPCPAGAEAALILNNSVPGMRNSNTFETLFSTDMSESPSDIAFSLAVLDSPSSSDTTTILPTSVKKISAGQTYYLELWVSDSGYINTGLTSAYVDLSFPANAATVTDVSYGGIFTLFNDESVRSGKIDELGGSTVDGVGVEPEWARVAVVQMYADATLPFVTFTLSPSSMGVAAWGRGSIDWSDISLGSLLICPADFDGDADVDTVDLAIIASAWHTRPGDAQWNQDCDISIPADSFINMSDLAFLVDCWLVGTQP